MTDLHEVITTNPTGGAFGPTARSFGQTFTDRNEAIAYARYMRRAGFEADLSPVFATVDTAAAALRQASRFYDSGPVAQLAYEREQRDERISK